MKRFEVNRTSERPRRRWKRDVRMDHQKVGWGGTDCIYRAQAAASLYTD